MPALLSAAPRGSAIPRVLCVDDDPDILRLVGLSFDHAGFQAATATSGAAALAWIESHGLPDLAVVDIRMPDLDGLTLCQRIQEYCDLPVILLTAVADETTVVQALDTVAEDYVVKPFRPNELVSRARRVLRRFADFPAGTGPDTAVDERLAINFPRQLARVAGHNVPLTPTETKVLHMLMRSAPRLVSSHYLLGRIWPREEVFEDTLRVHVCRLRQKIERDPAQPAYIVTHRGRGYSFGAMGAAS
jgi:DNA-binding response OmpR family regulator